MRPVKNDFIIVDFTIVVRGEAYSISRCYRDLSIHDVLKDASTLLSSARTAFGVN